MGQNNSRISINGAILILVAIATLVSCAVLFVPQSVMEQLQCAIFPCGTSIPDAELTDTEVPPATVAQATPPTDTPVLMTDTALPTNSPTITQTPVATNTPERGYPCETQVDPNAESSILSVVRQYANPNSNIVNSVRRGETVTVLERSGGSSNYYRIQSNGQTLGWISNVYLVSSSVCP